MNIEHVLDSEQQSVFWWSEVHKGAIICNNAKKHTKLILGSNGRKRQIHAILHLVFKIYQHQMESASLKK